MRKQHKVLASTLSELGSAILGEKIKVLIGDGFWCNMNAYHLDNRKPIICVHCEHTGQYADDHDRYDYITAEVWNTHKHMLVSQLMFGFLHELGHFMSSKNQDFDFEKAYMESQLLQLKVNMEKFANIDEVWRAYSNITFEKVATKWAFHIVEKSLPELVEIDKIITSLE